MYLFLYTKMDEITRTLISLSYTKLYSHIQISAFICIYLENKILRLFYYNSSQYLRIHTTENHEIETRGKTRADF